MRAFNLRPGAALLCFLYATLAYAQPLQPTVAVPKLVRFSGSFRPASGSPAQTMESLTLSVYRDQTGGDVLWHEIQNVVVDTDGRYSVLMGATKDEGVPVDLFASGEPRWLGVQFNRAGEAEQPRVLLVSVPYALKAADADTLGGKPASAYLLAAPALGTNTIGAPPVATSAATPVKSQATPANHGQPNYIGKFANTTDLVNSAMYEVNGNVGIFTTQPAISLDVRTGVLPQMGIAGTTDYLTFFASDQFGPAIYWDPARDMRFGKGGTGLYNPFGFVEQMRIQSSTGFVGIGTQAPASKLEVAGDLRISGSGSAVVFPDGSRQTTAGGAGSPGSNPQAVAQLRWYPANLNVGYSTGFNSEPFEAAFDGANMWVSDALNNTVVKMRAFDGAILGTFPVGTTPKGVAFDGASIWVAAFDGTVTKLRASDGANLGTFSVTEAQRVAFDGANVWVTSFAPRQVTKLRASDGANLGTFPVGNSQESFTSGIAFDGTNIWVGTFGGGNGAVTKLLASDGTNLGTWRLGSVTAGIAFDGFNIWVAIGDSVTKLRASDAIILGVFPTGSATYGVAFDTANIWVTNQGDNTVTKLRASDGANLGTFPAGTQPSGIAFDGVYVWVVDTGNGGLGGGVSKM